MDVELNACSNALHRHNMKNNWTSIWYLAGRKALSRSRRGWWTGVFEATIASILILAGIVLLTIFVTVNVITPPPANVYSWLLEFILKPLIAITMSGIGCLMIFNAIWKTGASEERRGAIMSKANQLELLNEVRKRRGDLPNVPSKSHSPAKGQTLPFRIIASRRSLWGLLTAGLLCLAFVTVCATLLITAYIKLKMGRADWVAGLLAVPISFAAVWSFYRFLRQFLKTTSLGPTTLELAQFPIIPGHQNKVFLSQSGRSRLKLLDVQLVCIEEATFNQGTTSITQRRRVYVSRMFRKRGIQLETDKPFTAEFEFHVPAQAMHSFQSSSNRITWQIEIHGKTKGLPAVNRIFEITVIPVIDDHQKQMMPARQSR